MSVTPEHRRDWSGLAKNTPNAPVAVLGIPFDSAVSFRQGASHAPARIRQYSHFVTPITEEGNSLDHVSVYDYGNVERDLDWERYFSSVENAAKTALKHPFALFLGGDHSVTIPLHRAFNDTLGKSFGILHLDAHTDLCDTYMGSRWSHACTERRALELSHMKPEHLVFIGIRSWEASEIDFLRANPGITVHSARSTHVNGGEAVAADAVAKLRHLDAVYLTLDIDVLDPAYAPGTGTPESGGLTSRQLIELLRLVFAELPIKAMDIVEVAPPLDHSDITSVAALKIIYEVFGWVK